MHYRPGSHLIASLKTPNSNRITDHLLFRNWIDDRIQQYRLHKLGEVWHDFSPAGYTGVICLSESHLSIHTWPEHLLINLDIYLSNYERSNDNTVKLLFEEIRLFFESEVIQFQTIVR